MKVLALAKASERVSEGPLAVVQRRVNLRRIHAPCVADTGTANAEDCAEEVPGTSLNFLQLQLLAAKAGLVS